MASTNDDERLSVSVYLLKKAKTAEAKKSFKNFSKKKTYTLSEEFPDGRFFAMPAEPQPPGWLNAISELLGPNQVPKLTSQFPGALLWVPYNGRTFVFAFGNGHTKVKDEWVVPDFGKVVALSVVSQVQVRGMRAEQVFAKRHIADERAPMASEIREFGFEADRDLVAAVEGVPDKGFQEIFGKRVRGGTSFKFDLDLSRVPRTLHAMAERYDSNDHQLRWPQANNFVLVRDPVAVKRLDAQLGRCLATKQSGQLISLSAPREVNGDKPYPQYFVIGRLTSAPARTPYLALAGWEGYLASRKASMDLQAARATRVHLLDDEIREIGSCSIYECLGYEASLKGTTYVLSAGNWYAASNQFIVDTNAKLANLGMPIHPLTAWNGKHYEGDYNKSACAIDHELWLFDKELVHFGGGASRFEYCDIMHRPSRTLYFVKHPSGSAGVSHLCEQVRRTAEAFFSPDSGYRKKLAERIEKIGKGWETTWLQSRPKRHEWNLCLVLMGKELNDLPFFAKCGIARLLGELERGGYNVTFQAV